MPLSSHTLTDMNTIESNKTKKPDIIVPVITFRIANITNICLKLCNVTIFIICINVYERNFKSRFIVLRIT